MSVRSSAVNGGATRDWWRFVIAEFERICVRNTCFSETRTQRKLRS